METATHFLNNNSCVYSCFLDAYTVTSGTVCAHNGSVTHLEVVMYATA